MNHTWRFVLFILLAGLLLYYVVPDMPSVHINLGNNDYDFDNWQSLSLGGWLIGIAAICLIGLILVPVVLGLSLAVAAVVGLAIFVVVLAIAPLLLPGIILFLLVYLAVKKRSD